MPYKWSAKDVGPGWAKIVQPLIDRAEREGVPITQIKEKFGGLRFYVGPASEEFYKVIDQAERDSLTVCERCGEPGTLEDESGWIRTRCNKHKGVIGFGN